METIILCPACESDDVGLSNSVPAIWVTGNEYVHDERMHLYCKECGEKWIVEKK